MNNSAFYGGRDSPETKAIAGRLLDIAANQSFEGNAGDKNKVTYRSDRGGGRCHRD